MADNDAKNVLSSAQQIMDYLGISTELYTKFRVNGVTINNKTYKMPVLIDGKRHYATKQNLDTYWNTITMCDSSKFSGEGDD